MRRTIENARHTGKRVLALVTDAYGGYGGIAAYNRDMIEALCEDERVAEVIAVPRLVPQPITAMPAKLRFDVAGARGSGSFLSRLLRHALGARIDLIYCAHIHHVPIAWLIAKLTRTPWVLCLYGVDGWRPTGRALADRLAGKADHYVSLSQLTLNRFRQVWPVDAVRCTVISNAIHLEQFGMAPKNRDLLVRYGLEGRTVLLTFGRLDETEQAKGFDRVIALLPRLRERIPNISYLICGHGGDRVRLEALAEEYGVGDRVVFTGMIAEAEKAEHYRLADLYVMPSKLEGFGFVFLEAMACGIPVVASTIDGGREAVLEGEIGQMIDPFDVDALEQAIYRGLEQPHSIPSRLSHFSYPNFRTRVQAALYPVMRR